MCQKRQRIWLLCIRCCLFSILQASPGIWTPSLIPCRNTRDLWLCSDISHPVWYLCSYSSTLHTKTMYCLQWLLPVLLIPKPLNPALWFNHSMFMGFYLLSFLLERKPCTICALVFLAALFLICYSCWGNCFLYHCHHSQLPDSAQDPNIVGT